MLAAVQSPDGKIYGLPTGVYGMGLHYNRDLFKAAGLDPDKPADHLGATCARTPRPSTTRPASPAS